LPLVLAQLLSLWVLVKHPDSHAWKESAGTFLSLMVGASIALISQTYNIPGDTADFILIWMFLIAPVVYFMQASLSAAIYAAGIAAWAGYVTNSPLQSFFFWPLMAVIVPHFIWTLKQDRYKIRATILSLVMAVAICFGTGFTLGRTLSGSWIFIFSSLIALFYFLGSSNFSGLTTNWQRPLRVLSGLGAFVMMFSLTFKFPWDSVSSYGYLLYGGREISSWNAVPDHILTFVLLAAALLVFITDFRRKEMMNASFTALPLVALIGYAFCGLDGIFSMWLFNAYLFIVSVLRIISGIKSENLRVVNTGMFMLAVLIIARFFDSDINFVLKGLVFILIGAGFLTTNVMILRNKRGQS